MRPEPNRSDDRLKPAKKLVARRGRPPGNKSGASVGKEKVTLRIDSTLIADYRERSWDQRCQLGELVQKALEFYRRRNWTAPSGQPVD